MGVLIEARQAENDEHLQLALKREADFVFVVFDGRRALTIAMSAGCALMVSDVLHGV